MFVTEDVDTGIPMGLDVMAPGPHLAAILSSIDIENLAGRSAVVFARAQERQISHDQARHYRSLLQSGRLLHLGEPGR